MVLKLSNIKNNIYYIIFVLLFFGYAVFPMKTGLGTGFIGLALIFWIFYENTLKKVKGLFEDSFSIVCLCILLVSVVTLTYSVSTWETGIERSLNRCWKFIASAFLLVLMKDAIYRRVSIWAFMCGVGFIVVSMYLNVYFDLPWSVTKNSGWGADHTVVGDYITQNLMLCLFILLCIDCAFKSSDKKIAVFFFFVSLLSIFAVFVLSPGRTGYVLASCSVLVYLISKIKGPLKFIIPLVFIIAGFFIYQNNSLVSQRVDRAVFESNKMMSEIRSGQTPEITSIGARIFMWTNTIDLVMQKPIMGWGIGGYKAKWCDQVPDEAWCDYADTHPHNQYLMFWVEMGISGLILFLALIGIMVKKALQARGEGALLLAFVAFFAIDCLFNSPLWVNREYQFFLLMLPLIYARVKYDNK